MRDLSRKQMDVQITRPDPKMFVCTYVDCRTMWVTITTERVFENTYSPRAPIDLSHGFDKHILKVYYFFKKMHKVKALE